MSHPSRLSVCAVMSWVRMLIGKRTRRVAGSALLGVVLAATAASILPPQALCVGFCRCCGQTKCFCQAVCECDEKAKKAWEDYQRHLKVVLDLYDNAFDNGDKSLERFTEDMNDILKEMGAPGTSIYPKGVTSSADWAELSREEVKLAAEEAARRARAAKSGLANPLSEAPKAATPVSVVAEVIATIVELALYSKEVYDTTNNLNYATASEAKQFAQAHEKWEQALNDLKQALAKEKECEDVKKKLDAEERLEKHASHYVQTMGLIKPDGSVVDVYYVGGKEYKDAKEALEAAKNLLRAQSQSRFSDRQLLMWVTSLVQSGQAANSSSDTYRVPREKVEQALQQVTVAETHLRNGASLIRDELANYGRIRTELRVVRSQMGTGQ